MFKIPLLSLRTACGPLLVGSAVALRACLSTPSGRTDVEKDHHVAKLAGQEDERKDYSARTATTTTYTTSSGGGLLLGHERVDGEKGFYTSDAQEQSRGSTLGRTASIGSMPTASSSASLSSMDPHSPDHAPSRDPKGKPGAGEMRRRIYRIDKLRIEHKPKQLVETPASPSAAEEKMTFGGGVETPVEGSPASGAAAARPINGADVQSETSVNGMSKGIEEYEKCDQKKALDWEMVEDVDMNSGSWLSSPSAEDGMNTGENRMQETGQDETHTSRKVAQKIARRERRREKKALRNYIMEKRKREREDEIKQQHEQEIAKLKEESDIHVRLFDLQTKGASSPSTSAPGGRRTRCSASAASRTPAYTGTSASSAETEEGQQQAGVMLPTRSSRNGRESQEKHTGLFRIRQQNYYSSGGSKPLSPEQEGGASNTKMTFKGPLIPMDSRVPDEFPINTVPCPQAEYSNPQLQVPQGATEVITNDHAGSVGNKRQPYIFQQSKHATSASVGGSPRHHSRSCMVERHQQDQSMSARTLRASRALSWSSCHPGETSVDDLLKLRQKLAQACGVPEHHNAACVSTGQGHAQGNVVGGDDVEGMLTVLQECHATVGKQLSMLRERHQREETSAGSPSRKSFMHATTRSSNDEAKFSEEFASQRELSCLQQRLHSAMWKHGDGTTRVSDIRDDMTRPGARDLQYMMDGLLQQQQNASGDPEAWRRLHTPDESFLNPAAAERSRQQLTQVDRSSANCEPYLSQSTDWSSGSASPTNASNSPTHAACMVPVVFHPVMASTNCNSPLQGFACCPQVMPMATTVYASAGMAAPTNQDWCEPSSMLQFEMVGFPSSPVAIASAPAMNNCVIWTNVAAPQTSSAVETCGIRIPALELPPSLGTSEPGRVLLVTPPEAGAQATW